MASHSPQHTEPKPPVQVEKRVFPAGDAIAVSLLLALIALVAWNRFVFDSWLTRFDVSTQFLPWYSYLGERVGDLEVPAWNPYLLGGAPFAGHPLSGWMYLPAVISFALLPVLAGFKLMVASHLILAGLSTYAYIRVLGMGSIAALAGALVFIFGPFLEWNTYTSLQFAQFAAWVPLLLLGIEFALHADRWRDRLVPWCLSGIALSQMFAAWVGEGWIYALLLSGSYVGYRALISPPQPACHWQQRISLGVATGAAILASGVALGAAGILPRLATNAESSLAGADYAAEGAAGILNPPWEPSYLVTQMLGLGSGYHFRAAGFGAAVVILMLLALLLSGRRFAVPYFGVLTAIALVLTLDQTPLHQLFYLIPHYRELHEHDPWRSIALASIGPAVLSAAAIERIGNLRGRYQVLPLVIAPLVGVMAFALTGDQITGVIGWAPILAAIAVTEIAVIVIAMPSDTSLRTSLRWIPRALLSLILVIVFLQPTGLELTGSWLGWPSDPRWANRWHPDPGKAEAMALEVSETDPGGVGEFLQQKIAEDGPFRFLGYGGVEYPGGEWTATTYMDRRFDPYVQGILANGRAVFLHLYSIQGYDPIQLRRYTEFMAALNGAGQDYHTAFVIKEGTHSPLLNLLDVRYVIISGYLPSQRDDVTALNGSRPEIMRTDTVVLYETRPNPPHAWIVHDVRSVQRGDALPLLTSGDVDPYQTALVEGTPPQSEHANDPDADRATVTNYGTESLTITTHTDAPGFLVVSEIYANGWRAYINGKQVEILPTDHALRGIPVPAGNATIEMHYEPAPLQLGLAVTGGTVVLMLAIFAFAGWRRWRAWRSRDPAQTRILPMPVKGGSDSIAPSGATHPS